MKELENFRKFLKEEESPIKNKYVYLDKEASEDFGEDWYSIDRQKALDYLSQFNNADVSAKRFMKDEEGFDQFVEYLEDDLDKMTDEELEKAMKEEMSFYFFSKPDEI
jgi:hypothetical protein